MMAMELYPSALSFDTTLKINYNIILFSNIIMSMNRRQRPNIMRHIGLSSGESQSMRVETRVLEPRTFSQSSGTAAFGGGGGQVSFDLPREGLLDQDVFLDLQVTHPTPAGTQGLPIMVGILGCLQTGTIYYNNILLQQTTELAQLLQLKMCFVEQDIRNQTYQVKIGSFSGLMVDHDSLVGGGVGTTSVGKYSYNASSVGNGIVGLQQGINTPTGLSQPDQYDKVPDYRMVQTVAEAPVYSIPLKWIFPFLTQIQLPLGLLEGQIRVVFDFEADFNGNRAIAYSYIQAPGTAPVAANWVTGNTITQSNCKLVIDLVYFDDVDGVNPMERLAQEVMTGIELVYTDYTFIESVITAGTGGANPELVDTSVLCGLDHQVVRNILVAIPNRVDHTVVAQTGPSNPILGNCGSCASQGQTTLQIVINNSNVYPNAINSDAKLFNEISQVFNTPMKTGKGQTSWVGSINPASAALNSEPQQEAFPRDKYMCGLGPGAGLAVFGSGESCLQGSLAYYGVNLSRTHQNILGAGTSIGKSPVEIRLTLQQSQQVSRARRLLAWAEVERVMVIRGGQIIVSGS